MVTAIKKVKSGTTTVPTVIAKVSLLFVKPTILASSVCPHCDELNFVQISHDQKETSILHSCDVCETDYNFEVPDFSLLNKTTDDRSKSSH